MKNVIKRLSAAILACAMLISVVPAALALDIQYRWGDDIGNGLHLEHTKWIRDGGGTRDYYIMDYTPGLGVAPIVASAGNANQTATVTSVISGLEAKGHTVLSAFNSDFFHTSTGVPTGMLILDGRLCVSDGAWNAVGFFEDGTAIVGAPSLNITMRRSNGSEVDIYALNKTRTNAGIYLYSQDFASTTKTTNPGYEVLLQAQPGEFLRLGEPLKLTVIDAGEYVSTNIGPNQFVISLTKNNTPGIYISDLVPGDDVVITASSPNTAWHDVIYSSGGGNMIARYGELTSSATTGSEPRTVLGVKPDGSVSVIVCDGRRSGHSDGMSLRDAAQLLLERGCTDVINLDGGGSTSLNAREPGSTSVPLVSKPSGGNLRACAVFIAFVVDAAYGEPESTAVVYPRNPKILAGASTDFYVKTHSDNFFPGNEYHSGSFYASAGDINGSTFTAPSSGGTVYISSDLNGLKSTDAVAEVVTQAAVKYFVLSGQTSRTSTLAIGTSETADLDVYLSDGIRRIISDDKLFGFTVSGDDIGYIDEDGVFTSGSIAGVSGQITARYEDITITLPVTVGKLPEILTGFEKNPTFHVNTSFDTTAAEAAAISPGARYGATAAYFSYIAQEDTEHVQFIADSAIKLQSGAKNLTFAAKGTGYFSIDFNTDSGVVSVPFDVPAQWDIVTVEVPSGAASVAGFSAGADIAMQGNLTVDQIFTHFGDAYADGTPPVISEVYYDGTSFTAVISDDYYIPMTKDNISLTLDGKPVSFTYTDDTGLLSYSPPVGQTGLHKISVVVTDYFGNISRDGVSYGENDLSVFGDISGHWSQDYAEYLCNVGVLSVDTSFNPGQNVTNAMAAVMISRYLGVNTDLYENVELPYYDIFNIPEWALPHVKAMYSMGIMVGGHDGVNSVFYPQRDATRAQIMTILGRTLDRGYAAYSPAPFADRSDIPAWAEDHIDFMYSMGIVEGYGDNMEIRSRNTITRAEFASLLFKMY